MYPAWRVLDARGVTLLELMLVLVLAGIFFGVVYDTVIIGLRAVNAADERETIRQELTSAMERFVRDAGTGNNVDSADTARFQFDTPSVNDVEYTYDSAAGTLSRDDAATSSRVILRDLTAFDFNFFDSAGTQLSEPVAGSAEDTIRVVEVTATVTKDQEALTVDHAVFIRNL
ncbi:MAG: prepilin-type N-terminal cleavage/methylation domain-containing protein [Candidatus Omnitrophica bacterium]|nr:prepilin-type N-terminal cleavage/methylation domain-containing protein [Candidatus Omnitrophota bacterium]